jgi:hypothetical protein
MSLFRKAALDAYLDEGDRGAIIRIVSPAVTASYLLLCALALTGVVLLFVGRSRQSAEGRGFVETPSGPLVVRAPSTGTLSWASGIDSAAAGASSVKAGAQLFVIAPLGDRGGPRVEGSAPVEGTVVELLVPDRSAVREGDAVATLLPRDAPLVGYMAIRERDRGAFVAGAAVKVHFDAAGVHGGEASARVRKVHDQLLTDSWRARLQPLGGLPTGALSLVEVTLDSPTEAPLHRGMVFTGMVVVRDRPLVELLAPEHE